MVTSNELLKYLKAKVRVRMRISYGEGGDIVRYGFLGWSEKHKKFHVYSPIFLTTFDPKDVIRFKPDKVIKRTKF